MHTFEGRRCPCCVCFQKPANRLPCSSHKSRSPGRSIRGREDEHLSYISTGDVFANRAFLKMIKKKYNNMPVRASSQDSNVHSFPRKTIYRVCPIKSKADLEEGDLIIETRDHKYLKVLGPAHASENEEFFIHLQGKVRKMHPALDFSSSSSR
uniref:Uncharacterized protein n=1 Tax=Schistocephalus solidus TaxID=70667 RepID=A0A0X3PTI0_SCHSO